MARSDFITLLPLDTYAKLMGISPIAFNRISFPSITPEPFSVSAANAAQPYWYQYDWQRPGHVSIDAVALAIQSAEETLAGFLGYHPAPTWTSQEMHQYPRENRVEYYGVGVNAHGQYKAVRTKWGRVISAGRRAVSLVDTPSVAGGELVYTDPNGNGWDTLATITVTTTLTDPKEIKLYFAGHSGDPAWEIRPLKTKVISGGTLTITLDSWLLIDPDLINVFPTDQAPGTIDGGDTANSYVQSVEVYREYADFTQPSANFYWEEPCSSCNGTGCAQCVVSEQDGCFHMRDVYAGWVVPTAAEYDAVDEEWDNRAWLESREPDYLKLWYYSGEQSERYLRDEATEPMDLKIAKAIAYMATARITCDFRSGNNVAGFVEYYRRNVTESFPNGSTIFTPPEMMTNPFGVLRGEIEAWRLMKHTADRNVKASAVAA